MVLLLQLWGDSANGIPKRLELTCETTAAKCKSCMQLILLCYPTSFKKCKGLQ